MERILSIANIRYRNLPSIISSPDSTRKFNKSSKTPTSDYLRLRKGREFDKTKNLFNYSHLLIIHNIHKIFDS